MLFCDIRRVFQIASQLWKLTPPEFLVLEIVAKIDAILCLDLNNVNPVEAGFVVFNWLLAKKNKKQTNKQKKKQKKKKHLQFISKPVLKPLVWIVVLGQVLNLWSID